MMWIPVVIDIIYMMSIIRPDYLGGNRKWFSPEDMKQRHSESDRPSWILMPPKYFSAFRRTPALLVPNIHCEMAISYMGVIFSTHHIRNAHAQHCMCHVQHKMLNAAISVESRQQQQPALQEALPHHVRWPIRRVTQQLIILVRVQYLMCYLVVKLITSINYHYFARDNPM